MGFLARYERKRSTAFCSLLIYLFLFMYKAEDVYLRDFLLKKRSQYSLRTAVGVLSVERPAKFYIWTGVQRYRTILHD